VKILITIEIPDGSDVAFTDAPGPELIPGQIESLAAPQFVPQQIIAPQPQFVSRPNPTCPAHHGSKFIPAGTNKQGKAYTAFWACDTPKGVCNWKQDA
jgi:hypothetical protein